MKAESGRKTGRCASGFCLSKSLAEFASADAKGIKFIFGRGVYVDKNTAQAASVEFGRGKRTNYAHSRLQTLCRKTTKTFFDSLNRTLCVRFLCVSRSYQESSSGRRTQHSSKRVSREAVRKTSCEVVSCSDSASVSRRSLTLPGSSVVT